MPIYDICVDNCMPYKSDVTVTRDV